MAARSAGRRRTCIGCRRVRPATELLRIALVGDELRVGRTLGGRGAWICAAGAACLPRALTPARLRRAFRREVPRAAAEALLAASPERGDPVASGVTG